MSYLQDRKRKQKKIKVVALVFLLLAVIFYFNAPIYRGLSRIFGNIFTPVVYAGQKAGKNFSDFFSSFESKVALERENARLKQEVYEAKLNALVYQDIMDENAKLKEILGRKRNEDMVLGNIISKDKVSFYNTILIDLGYKDGVDVGDIVFALGDIPIGTIAEATHKYSKVLLFSAPKEKTQVLLSGADTMLELVGRGGGSFELVLPDGMELGEGQNILLPGDYPYTVALFEKRIDDPRDLVAKNIFKSPVNLNQIKFVTVKK